MKRIFIAGPWITKKEIQYVTQAVKRGWYERSGYYQKLFEEKFAKYVGRKYSVSLPSCTSAIHLALLYYKIGPGDEVIVPDITWIATAAPIVYVGATPVFVDIDPNTWCLSSQSFQQCITKRTKAVIPVDLYGNMPEMDQIIKIARNKGIKVIEDAAEAIGSEYKGRKAGSFGEISVFSFHGSKTVTTGEGGMLVTDNKNIFERAMFLRDHGRKPGEKLFWNTEVAYKYKMSGLQAAMGLAQLERVEELVRKKRNIFGWYRQYLGKRNGVVLNCEKPGTKNSYWMTTAIIDKKFGTTKERLYKMLKIKNIDARPIFYPLSSLPAFRKYQSAKLAKKRNKTSYALSPFGLNLPSALNLTKNMVHYVSSTLIEVLKIK